MKHVQSQGAVVSNRVLLSVLICLVAAGCQNIGVISEGPPPPAVVVPVSRAESVSAELARDHFAAQNFALAERNFREAVESNSSDFQSWVGLAASYDKLGRFELADRAYSQAVLIGGETIEVLNNRGYSYLLRGDKLRARLEFERAQLLDPRNSVIANNIRLLLKTGPDERRRLR